MNKSILALGIESSCDDTAIGVVKLRYRDSGQIISGISGDILGSKIFDQKNLHREYGGVVPEIAARAHSEKLNLCLEGALESASVKIENIELICVTSGPGLIGGLIAGINFAKGMAFSLKKDLVGVNHLIGHALTPRLTDSLNFPYLMLLASGGHCQYLAVGSHNKIIRLGTTIDDAPGEAFDKVAKMVGLRFSSGAEVEIFAKCGDVDRFNFPTPLINEDSCDLSFSGLKSAVSRQVNALIEKQGGLYKKDQRDICAGFQKSMVKIFERKTEKAFDMFKNIYPNTNISFSLSGGVAANIAIRNRLKEISRSRDALFSAPPLSLCTDNGNMIAYAGAIKYIFGEKDDFLLAPRTRWPVDLENNFSIGYGKRGRKV